MHEWPTEEIMLLRQLMMERVFSPNGGSKTRNADSGLIQLGYNEARAAKDSDVIAWAKGYCLFFEEAEIQLLPHEILACFFNNATNSMHLGVHKPDGAISGHFSVDYSLMLSLGILGGLKYIEDWRSKILFTPGKNPDPRSADFYTACEIVWRGFGSFLQRYKYEAEKRLKEANLSEIDKKWVEKMAQTMGDLQQRPPSDLYEAISLITLYHMVIQLTVGCCSFGQPDQFLYPYYLQSLKNGVALTEIKTILAAWFIKLNEFMDVPQGLMLGGQNAQAESVSNDLTLLMLEVAGDLNLVNPAMSFGWNPLVPQRYMDQIMKNYARGVMHPQLFNDQVLISGFERIGVAHADAVRYVNCTCTEPTTTGCSNIFVVACYLNPNRDLLKVVHGGNFQGVQDALDPQKAQYFSYEYSLVPEFERFEEFLDAFLEELALEIDQQAASQIRFQKMRIETFAQPLVSLFMHDCMEKGLDLAWGGGRYNFAYMQMTGFSTLIDSLYTIKELVYTAKSHTLPQLGEIIAQNWRGHEELRQKVINKIRKWGNDYDEIDHLGQYIAEKYQKLVEKHHGIFQNGGFYAGYLNWVVHSQYGRELGATPDGRLEKLSLSNSFAPAQGVGKEGLTAICNSAAKIPQNLAIGACTLNLTLLQSSLDREEQRSKFGELLQTYFLKGGTQVQVNIFDKAKLIEAQRHPERYPELVVKVGGYSARYIDLDLVLQEEIIQRNGFTV